MSEQRISDQPISDQSNSDQRSPIDQVLDLLVYAPLGLAITAGEELPKLAEKGRQQLASQVPTARAIGQLAVSQGQKQAERMARQASQRLADLGLLPECPPSRTSEPAPTGASTQAPSTPASSPAAPSPEPATAAASAAPDLAIPGYDALSAPQVVQRLDGLSAEELEAVRAYESATRRRKTVLTRIAQLQGE